MIQMLRRPSTHAKHQVKPINEREPRSDHGRRLRSLDGAVGAARRARRAVWKARRALAAVGVTAGGGPAAVELPHGFRRRPVRSGSVANIW